MVAVEVRTALEFTLTTLKKKTKDQQTKISNMSKETKKMNANRKDLEGQLDAANREIESLT